MDASKMNGADQMARIVAEQIKNQEDISVLQNCDMEGPVDHTTLTKQVVDDLVSEAKDFAYCSGLVLHTADQPASQDVVTHAPFTLFPSPVPRQCFEAAMSVQKDFNILMHKVAHDYQFLKDCLQSAVKVDEFTAKIWNIYETVRKEGIAQPLTLTINRSDYMFDTGSHGPNVNSNDVKLRQIEFNTMASSFAGLSTEMQHLHKFTLNRVGKPEQCKHLPQNNSVNGLAKAVIAAWKAYNNPSSVIVILVLEVERNTYDQRKLQYAINRANPDVRVIRRTIRDFAERGKLAENKCLMIDGFEAAIVYQRCCYVPNHFNGDQDWEALLLIERSRAIKCPSSNYHLAGTKKIQQVLASPGVLETFLDDKEAVCRIRGTFAGQYSLDLDPEGDANARLATEKPELFVLKPQREGGGNNIFGADIKQKLLEMEGTEERTAYILMERIHPMKIHNYPVSSGKAVDLHEMVSEIGIFGTLIGTKDEILLNEESGYILRTKTSSTDEGGVASGFAVLDCAYLV